MVWAIISMVCFAAIFTVVFWPELTCWLPSARNDRREGYADGMGGKRAQLARSDAYYAGWHMGSDDDAMLRHKAKGTC